jgi:nicotinamide-nucleotide adenylyltransferase
MSTALAFFDLSVILELRRVVRELAPTAAPALRTIAAPEGKLRRLALLPGSFNPVTDAHLALAEQARRSGRVEAVSYLLASRTVNKERLEGATLEDRLICLRGLVRDTPDAGVVLVNRGLYVDQAEIARAAFPSIEELWFVVGHDKIEQIFDHRYYADYHAALDRLFRLASFLVTPRGEAGPAELAALLARPENRAYADRVHALDLPSVYRDDSSSRERSRLGAGQAPGDVPPLVATFVRETGAYAPPLRVNGDLVDRYRLRERLVNLVDQGSLRALRPVEFRALFRWLLSPGKAARHGRDLAERGEGIALVEHFERERAS